MSGSQPLDERYFDWLCGLVGARSTRDPAGSHIQLAAQMYRKPFDDSTPNDFNRSLDGKDLRVEFLELVHLTADRNWLELDCSFLELLIGLARRLSFQTDWAIDACFWLMMTNLELDRYSDERYNDGITEAVEFVLNTVNERTYERSGRGGLFPLRDPQLDQRGVEIWYQMSAYLLEEFQ